MTRHGLEANRYPDDHGGDWDAVVREQHEKAERHFRATGDYAKPLLVRDWRFVWRRDREQGRPRDEVEAELRGVVLAVHRGGVRWGSLSPAQVLTLFEQEWPKPEGAAE